MRSQWLAILVIGVKMKQITSNKTADFQIGGPKSTYVIIICSLLWMVNFMDRQVLAVVLEPMKLDLGLTDAQAGWITTALLLSMASFAIPVSYLADKWSRKGAIGIMAIVWSLATALTGMGRNFGGIFLPRFATGAGQAGYSSAAIALISASYPESVRAKKMGVFNLFQIVGISVGMILGGYLSANLGGWRTPFYVFTIPGVILGFLAFFMQDYRNVEPASSNLRESGFVYNIKTLLRIRTLIWFYAGYALFSAAAFAMLGWIPSLIIRKFGVGEDIAGVIMAVTGVFMVPGVLLGGILADKWEEKRTTGRMGFATVMVLLSSFGSLSSMVFVFVLHEGGFFEPSIWIIAGGVMFVVFIASAAAVNPSVMAVSQTVVTPDLKGLVWGLGVSLVMVLGGAWSPAATGYLSDWLGGAARGLALALIIVSALGFGSFICFWRSSHYYPVDAQKAKALSAAWD
jgi:MFS family permease